MLYDYILINLRTAHAKGKVSYGLNLYTGEIEDMTKAGIEDRFVDFQFEHEVFHPVKSSSINVHPFVYLCKEMATVIPDPEIERGGWYKLGSEVKAHDQNKGDYIIWNEDIVWGLTFRIYDSLKNMLYEMSRNND